MDAYARLRKFALAAGTAVMLVHAPAWADVAEVSALIRAKQFPAALEKADAHLKTQAQDPQMRFLKGLVLSALNRRDDAIALFTQLSTDFPSLPEPYNNLAVLHAAEGDYDKARIALENAVKANPHYARAHENLADVYAQLASQSYAAMLRLEPENEAVKTKQTLLRSAIGYRDERPGVVPVAATAQAAAPSQLARNAPAPRASTEATASEAVDRTEVLNALNDWAKAWSTRDVAAYLETYTPNFRPNSRQSHRRWADERRARIENKSFIEIEVASPVVRFESGRARTEFTQTYKSDSINEVNRKVLTWEKQDGNWKIVREEVRG